MAVDCARVPTGRLDSPVFDGVRSRSRLSPSRAQDPTHPSSNPVTADTVSGCSSLLADSHPGGDASGPCSAGARDSTRSAPTCECRDRGRARGGQRPRHPRSGGGRGRGGAPRGRPPWRWPRSTLVGGRSGFAAAPAARAPRGDPAARAGGAPRRTPRWRGVGGRGGRGVRGRVGGRTGGAAQPLGRGVGAMGGSGRRCCSRAGPRTHAALCGCCWSRDAGRRCLPAVPASAAGRRPRPPRRRRPCRRSAPAQRPAGRPRRRPPPPRARAPKPGNPPGSKEEQKSQPELPGAASPPPLRQTVAVLARARRQKRSAQTPAATGTRHRTAGCARRRCPHPPRGATRATTDGAPAPPPLCPSAASVPQDGAECRRGAPRRRAARQHRPRRRARRRARGRHTRAAARAPPRCRRGVQYPG